MLLAGFALVSGLGLPLHPARAELSVSPGGQAGFSLPIAVPPGIAGMAPTLAFSYADGGINGPLGVGWSVQGISFISRCPSQRVIDGSHRTVMLDAGDKLCLDGQRLIQTGADGRPSASQVNDAAGLAGGAFREYRTEKDGYSRIRAYGAIGGDVALGPTHFKVWTKSGQILHFGMVGTDAQALVLADPTGSGTPRVGAVWAVARISDTLGNYIDFRYEQRMAAWGSGPAAAGREGREWNVREILYTGTPSQPPANRIVFDYVDRPATLSPGHDRSEAYQQAHKNVSVRRLAAVTSFVHANSAAPVAVRNHQLAFERSPVTGRSRLTSIRECAGSATTRCLPPVRFRYTTGAPITFTADPVFSASPMATVGLLDGRDGNFGVFSGDFDGDGRTDLLRWSTTPAQNELWLSSGGGAFRKATAFNVTADVLFSRDDCYHSQTADFNGDTLSDILRVGSPKCAGARSKLFLSRGDGSFTPVDLPAEIDFGQETSTETRRTVTCTIIQKTPRAPATTGSLAIRTDPPAPPDEQAALEQERDGRRERDRIAVNPQPTAVDSCYVTNRSEGRGFHLVDADGDGFLDILTARRPGFLSWSSTQGPLPTPAQECLGYYDQRVGDCNITFYRGSATGSFSRVYSINGQASLYANPPKPLDKSNPYWRSPNQADINGDGLQDIFAVSGAWRSNGDGYFTPGANVTQGGTACGLPIDFNGDQRVDCLLPDKVASSQALVLHYGATQSAAVAQFNLKSPGQELFGQEADGRQTIGVVVEDFDGDGRGDILRWAQDPAANAIYLSNGDGSFRPPAEPHGLSGPNGPTRPLQGSDGQTSFMLGDFLGNGTVQILHLKHAATNTEPASYHAHRLYVRSGAGIPTDQLRQVISPGGLVTTVADRVSLPNSGGAYLHERGTPSAGTGDILDVQLPIYVIPSVVRDTGAGTVTTRYVYKGLKAERNGRGLLGFRETRQQAPAADGSAQTVMTRYLQQHPYIGVAALSETYLGDTGLSGARISRVAYSYCDVTSAAAPAAIGNPAAPPAPCAVQSKVSRPYLYQSVEQGWDLAGTALPRVTTTNAYAPSGDLLQVVVETTGTTLGLPQTFVRTTTNEYFADQTSGDLWVLGRLKRTSVRSQVPNLLGSIGTVAGAAAAATTSTESPLQPAGREGEPAVAVPGQGE